MVSRLNFHGDGLFDQTHAQASRSLFDHPIDDFGAQRIRDTHEGVILHSGGRLSEMHAMQSLAAR